jgi:(2R)-ethylmalonyl-CoA mutase
MRAFVELWDEIGRERYGVTDEKQRRFRYGVQVNSLGLTEAQPENNVQRIVLEMLGVTLSKNARARAVQLPAWNEALGLPRPWDQQWSLRMQQVLAYETDLLEYDDIFDGSHVIEAKVAELVDAAAELDDVAGDGRRLRGGRETDEHEGRAGRVARRAHAPHRVRRADRRRRQQVHRDRAVAADAGEESDPDRRPEVERSRSSRRRGLARAARRGRVEARARRAARARRRPTENLMPPRSPAPAPASPPASGRARCARCSASTARRPASAARGGATAALDDGPRRGRARSAGSAGRSACGFLVGKPGLDGHSNGAEQIAVRARDAGMEVVYQGIRLTPEQIVAAARRRGRRRVGLSILSGSHMELVPDVLAPAARGRASTTCRSSSAASSPRDDARAAGEPGVAAVYTPKDFELSRRTGRGAGAGAASPRPGQRQVEDQQHDVGDEQAGDQAPHQVRLFGTAAGRAGGRSAGSAASMIAAVAVSAGRASAAAPACRRRRRCWRPRARRRPRWRRGRTPRGAW